MHKRMLSRLASLGLGLCLLLPLLLTCGCGTPADPLGTSLWSSLTGQAADLDAWAQEVLTRTNEERAKEGLSPLTWNSKLAKAGSDHCQDMIDNNYFDHYSLTGSSPGDRATLAGYTWQWIGENIAAGYNTPESVVEGWMNSPDHRANILLPEFTELGVGIRQSPSGRYYWAQEFGTPF